MPLSGYFNMDCMEGMASIPDKYFDLAIVDPPYFDGPNKRIFYGRKNSPIGVKRSYQKIEPWDIPDKSYFDELIRISKHQIIWGCNYFHYSFGPGRIVWDKCNGDNSFSDAEIAYCSMHESTRIFKYMWNGMMQGKSISNGHIMQGNKNLNEKRIHPTQKPVNLYKWILITYAKPGFKIIDTHTGSASSLIACYDLGFEYLAFEKDMHTYTKSFERLECHMNQLKFNI